MKYSITKQGDGFSIRIDDVSGQEQTILERIDLCRQSAWACPSGECRNVGSIEEHVEAGSVFLSLAPRPGANIDRSGIEECLAYMLHQAVKE
jgi:hypothetical protein